MSDRENDTIAWGEPNLKGLEIHCVRLFVRRVPDDARNADLQEYSPSLASLPRFFEALAPESCRLPFRNRDQEHVDSAGDPAEQRIAATWSNILIRHTEND